MITLHTGRVGGKPACNLVAAEDDCVAAQPPAAETATASPRRSPGRGPPLRPAASRQPERAARSRDAASRTTAPSAATVLGKPRRLHHEERAVERAADGDGDLLERRLGLARRAAGCCRRCRGIADARASASNACLVRGIRSSIGLVRGRRHHPGRRRGEAGG